MSGNQSVKAFGDAGICASNANSGALAASLVVKATGGNLFGCSIHNTNAAVRYVQFFDLAALPADAVVPTLCYTVPARGDLILDFVPPRRFANGIVVCNSTTDTAKTIGAADTLFDVQYL